MVYSSVVLVSLWFPYRHRLVLVREHEDAQPASATAALLGSELQEILAVAHLDVKRICVKSIEWMGGCWQQKEPAANVYHYQIFATMKQEREKDSINKNTGVSLTFMTREGI